MQNQMEGSTISADCSVAAVPQDSHQPPNTQAAGGKYCALMRPQRLLLEVETLVKGKTCLQNGETFWTLRQRAVCLQDL